jgi:ribosomal protein S18 acetylase RimI-like enzyme
MIKITTIEKSRWKDYKKLRLEALTNDPITFGSSVNDEKKLTKKDWETRIMSSITDTLFAIDDNENLAGMIVALYEKKETQKHIARIVSFYVSPYFRRQKIGKSLFQKILTKIKQKKGIKKIKIQLYKNNLIALKMYKKFGFKKVGILNKEIKIKGRYYDDILMEKLI